jgi:hypothetical protein
VDFVVAGFGLGAVLGLIGFLLWELTTNFARLRGRTLPLWRELGLSLMLAAVLLWIVTGVALGSGLPDDEGMLVLLAASAIALVGIAARTVLVARSLPEYVEPETGRPMPELAHSAVVEQPHEIVVRGEVAEEPVAAEHVLVEVDEAIFAPGVDSEPSEPTAAEESLVGPPLPVAWQQPGEEHAAMIEEAATIVESGDELPQAAVESALEQPEDLEADSVPENRQLPVAEPAAMAEPVEVDANDQPAAVNANTEADLPATPEPLEFELDHQAAEEETVASVELTEKAEGVDEVVDVRIASSARADQFPEWPSPPPEPEIPASAVEEDDGSPDVLSEAVPPPLEEPLPEPVPEEAFHILEEDDFAGEVELPQEEEEPDLVAAQSAERPAVEPPREAEHVEAERDDEAVGSEEPSRFTSPLLFDIDQVEPKEEEAGGFRSPIFADIEASGGDEPVDDERYLEALFGPNQDNSHWSFDPEGTDEEGAAETDPEDAEVETRSRFWRRNR